MLIYRIEHAETGNGPYTSQGEYFIRGLKPGNEPQDDGINMIWGWHIGCESMESLCAWFLDAWRDLERHGFVVAVYRALDPSDVMKGGHQVAFRKRNAELIGKQQVRTILDHYA